VAAVILVIGGIGVYLLAWLDHDATPNPLQAGEWRSAPHILRRFLRKGTGPVLIGSATVELAGTIMLIVGLLTLGGPLSGPLSIGAAAALIGSLGLAVCSWAVISLRAEVWKRSGRTSDRSEK
jgi:hypothetical protein